MPEQFFKSLKPLLNGAKWTLKVAVNSFAFVFKAVPLMWKFCKCLCLNHINHLISSFKIAMLSLSCIRQKYFQLYAKNFRFAQHYEDQRKSHAQFFCHDHTISVHFKNNIQFILHWRHGPLIPDFWSTTLHAFLSRLMSPTTCGAKNFSKKLEASSQFWASEVWQKNKFDTATGIVDRDQEIYTRASTPSVRCVPKLSTNLEEILSCARPNFEEQNKVYVMKILMICSSHPIPFGWSNREEWVEWGM